MLEYEKTQHFTQPKPRYSEARLIKELEENGVGRPSTYANIIDTLKTRAYVNVEEKRFVPNIAWSKIGIIFNKTKANGNSSICRNVG